MQRAHPRALLPHAHTNVPQALQARTLAAHQLVFTPASLHFPLVIRQRQIMQCECEWPAHATSNNAFGLATAAGRVYFLVCESDYSRGEWTRYLRSLLTVPPSGVAASTGSNSSSSRWRPGADSIKSQRTYSVTSEGEAEPIFDATNVRAAESQQPARGDVDNATPALAGGAEPALRGVYSTPALSTGARQPVRGVYATPALATKAAPAVRGVYATPALATPASDTGTPPSAADEAAPRGGADTAGGARGMRVVYKTTAAVTGSPPAAASPPVRGVYSTAVPASLHSSSSQSEDPATIYKTVTKKTTTTTQPSSRDETLYTTVTGGGPSAASHGQSRVGDDTSDDDEDPSSSSGADRVVYTQVQIGDDATYVLAQTFLPV
jgi:hypothetical protein